MSKVSEVIHRHHQTLLETLTKQVRALREGQPEANPEALLTFLKDDLLPHAKGEERHLYPTVEPLLKAHGKATASMSVDHEFIEDYIGQIEETIQHLRIAETEDHARLLHQLHLLILQLEAILKVHLEKEERVYLPLFEQYLSETEQQQVLDRMHEAYKEETAGEAVTVKMTLDVRQTPPPQRHPMIFQTFEALKPGEAFILVNDHDPKPLYYQFKYEREGQFTWEYLEQGPEVWRVRIGRADR